MNKIVVKVGFHGRDEICRSGAREREGRERDVLNAHSEPRTTTSLSRLVLDFNNCVHPLLRVQNSLLLSFTAIFKFETKCSV